MHDGMVPILGRGVWWFDCGIGTVYSWVVCLVGYGGGRLSVWRFRDLKEGFAGDFRNQIP